MNWQEAAEYFARKRDTLIWGLKDNRDETRQAHDAYNEAIAALRGPQRDPETGLPPCGCGMPAVRIVNTEIMYNGKKRVKYSIKCPKNHVHTDCFETKLQADNYWHRAMGCPIK